LGAIGLYFLTITGTFTIAFGDFVVLIGAGFWAVHLLVIDHFLHKKVDALKLSFLQFSLSAILSTIAALIFEEISITAIIACTIPILYAGVLSGGVGFTLQIIGQKHTNPTVASLILSMEAVFGALFGFLILQEVLNMREIFGCILMFSAIIISQLPDKRKNDIP
jgi:drug/metabolite transporter (DMT)-like permease